MSSDFIGGFLILRVRRNIIGSFNENTIAYIFPDYVIKPNVPLPFLCSSLFNPLLHGNGISQRPFFYSPTVQSWGTFTYQNVLFLCRLYLSVRISGTLAILKRFFSYLRTNIVGIMWVSFGFQISKLDVFRFLLGMCEKEK